MAKKDNGFKALLADAKLPEETVPVCLRGDLLGRYNDLERQLSAARKADDRDSLAAGGQSAAIEAQMDAVQEEMRRGSYVFVLRALSKPDYIALERAHEPRKDNIQDLRSGHNTETFGPALIRACIVDPVLDDDDWDDLQSKLNVGEFAKLDAAATKLNFTQVSVPFLQPASPTTENSDSA